MRRSHRAAAIACSGRSARSTTSAARVLGAAIGIVLCWTVGAVLLYLPGQTELRRHAQDSTILSSLNEELPPEA